jgi:hypothetical protein
VPPLGHLDAVLSSELGLTVNSSTQVYCDKEALLALFAETFAGLISAQHCRNRLDEFVTLNHLDSQVCPRTTRLLVSLHQHNTRRLSRVAPLRTTTQS